ISVAQSCNKNQTRLQLQQKRFLENAQAKSSSQHWSLPICLPSHGRNPECQLLREKEQTLEFAGCGTDPVFLNYQGKGYFITEYHPEEESKLLKGAAKLEEAERMVFARDEWYLIMAGERSVGNFLDLAQ